MNIRSLLFAPLLFLVAFHFTGCVRRQYAQATVEFGAANDTAAENAIRALLPKDDPSVVLRPVRNTGLYEIQVYDDDGAKAAGRANEIATDLGQKLNSKSGEKIHDRDAVKTDDRADQFAAELEQKLNSKAGERRFRIWERAVPFAPIR